MIKYKKLIIIGIVFIILGGTSLVAAAQTTNRTSNIKSKGVLNYSQGTIVIDSSDLTYLAQEIDTLEDTYKSKTLNALNNIGTYFKEDGTITFNPAESMIWEDNAQRLTFDQLNSAVKNSQSVESVSAAQAANAKGVLYFKDSEAQASHDLTKVTIDDTGLPVYYKATKPENLSAGSAAWVNGEMILGNGADNNAYYAKGYTDGAAASQENAQITYTYHVHTGSSSTEGGCYITPICHKHTSACNKSGTKSCGCTAGDWEISSPQYGADGSGPFRDCNKCRHSKNGWDQHDSPCPTQISYSDIGCGKNETTIEGYQLGCGKTENTIESATIVFP